MPEEDNLDVKALYKELIGKTIVSIKGNEVPLYYITIPQHIDSDKHDFSIDRVISDAAYNAETLGEMADEFGEGAVRYVLAKMSKKFIYRGISFDSITRVLKEGSDRDSESVDYFDTKSKTGLDAKDIVYGAESIGKATEHARTNPQVMLLYNKDDLQRVEDEWYTYKKNDTTKPWSEILSGIMIIEKLVK